MAPRASYPVTATIRGWPLAGGMIRSEKASAFCGTDSSAERTSPCQAGGREMVEMAIMVSVSLGHSERIIQFTPLRRATSSVRIVGAIFSAAGRSPGPMTTTALVRSIDSARAGVGRTIEANNRQILMERSIKNSLFWSINKRQAGVIEIKIAKESRIKLIVIRFRSGTASRLNERS